MMQKQTRSKLLAGMAIAGIALLGCSSQEEEHSVAALNGEQTTLDSKAKALWQSLETRGVSEYFTEAASEGRFTLHAAVPAKTPCQAPALAMDDNTLFFDELETIFEEGTLVDGVCGKALSLSDGQVAPLGVNMIDSMKAGTVEFWFRPGDDFYDVPARTLLGNDGARVHFFMKNGELYFQKNHADQHFFVNNPVQLDSGWNLIAGQWGDGYMSLWLNGKLVAKMKHELGYAPAMRGIPFENLLVIGFKSECCMEGPGQYEGMRTSGSFDQFRISNIARYDIQPDQEAVVVTVDGDPDAVVVTDPVVEEDEPEAPVVEEPVTTTSWVVDYEFDDSQDPGRDFSGNGHHASVAEGNIVIDSGIASFDGVSGLELADGPSIKLGDFVVEARVFPTALDGFRNILVTEPPGFGPDGWIFRFQDGRLVFLVRDQDWGSDWAGVSVADMETDKWYDIRVECTSESIRLFLNGDLAAEKALSGNYDNLEYQWGVGYDAVHQSIHNRYFAGKMDYVRVGRLGKNNSADETVEVSCDENGLVSDEYTLFFDAMDSVLFQGTLVDGVCGKAISFEPGEVVKTSIVLADTIEEGTVEFWFRPGEDFYDESSRTILGTDESRMHFFVQNGDLIFQKNHADLHYFVRGRVEFKDGWNLIAGQWGDGYLSLFVNGELVAQMEHSQPYVPSLRNVSEPNLVVAGRKSGCCMEATSQYSAMTSSGAIDQVRISSIPRY